MGISIPLTPANPLASMIIAHEGDPLIVQSEAALYRARADELRQEADQTNSVRQYLVAREELG
jgi:hypothetical protein